MKLWGKLWKDNRMMEDVVITTTGDDTRTHHVLNALAQICVHFDLSQPIWLDATIREFQKHSKARFTRDSFVEEIPFDYLEIQVLEE